MKRLRAALLSGVGCYLVLLVAGCDPPSPTQVSVPDVVGLAQSAAETAITNAGLAVGTITEEFSFTVAEGDVISQDPAAGTRVSAGSDVALVVSLGPAVAGAMPIAPPPATPLVDSVAAITREASVTLSGTAEPFVLVEVNGGAAFNTAMAGETGAFTVTIDLHPDRINRLYVSAVDERLVRSLPKSVQVIQDGHTPEVFIDFPANGDTVYVESIDVAGRVADMLSGFMGLAVVVNGENAETDSGIGTNGTFLGASVPLAIGENTLVATATDEAGNTSTAEITVTRRALAGPRIRVLSGNGQQGIVNSQLPEPVVVAITEENGTPLANSDLTARVTRSDGQLSTDPEVPNPDGIRLDLQTDAQGRATLYWTLGTDAGCGNNRLEIDSAATENRVFYCATAMSDTPDQINISAGNNQKVEVGGESPLPLRVWVSDGNNGVAGTPVTFRLSGADGFFNGVEGQQELTVNTATSGFAEVTYTLGALDGHNLITADFPGNATTPATFDIIGLAREFDTPTTFTGRVLDNASCPIGGATIELSVDSDTLTATSDADGRFTFTDTPSGIALLHVIGETATLLNGRSVPAGTFPSLEFEVYIVPDTSNSLSMPVLLPARDPMNSRMYDGTEDVELTVDGLDGVKFTIAAGSMTLADGTRPSPENPVEVSLNQVHYDELPMPMPNGAAPSLTLTFHPPNAHYDPPVAVEYPNTANLAPGQIAYILSFNHDTSQFEIVSSASVSDDGATITSDPGSGIPTGGWNGQCPPYTARGKARDRCGVVAVVIFHGGTDIQDVLFAAIGRDFAAGLLPLKKEVDAVDPEKVRSFLVRSQSIGAVQLAIGNAWLEQLKRDLPPDCDPPKVVLVGYSLGGDTVRISGSIDADRRFAFDPIARELVFSLSGGCLAYQRAEAFPAPDNTETILAGELTGDAFSMCIPPRCDIGLIGNCLRGYRMTGGAISTIPAADHGTIVPLASPRVVSAVAELAAQLPKSRRVKGNEPTLALNETFTLMVGGQSYQPDQSGFFLIENISVPDDFGLGGPGTPRDMVSDEFVQITGSGEIDGETWYVFSDPFLVRNNGVEVIDSLVFRQTPPVLPVSIRATPTATILNGPGASTQMQVLATLADGSRVDISDRDDLTTYRTSNGRIATVSNDGLVTAVREGTVFITATNSGATSVARVSVVEGGMATTVIGSVADMEGMPVSGADISVLEFAAFDTTNADGSFSVPDIPGNQGNIAVAAQRIGDGPALVAVSGPVPPVPGGATDVGVLEAMTLCELFPSDCADGDGDGVRDSVEATLGLLPGDNDSDDNGILDGAEDLDNDGLSVLLEDALRTSSGSVDTDQDGLTDSAELRLGTSPINDDSDGDGLLDGEDDDPTRADDIMPEVSLTSPALGTVLVEGQMITLAAEASDNGRVGSVRFSANGIMLGTDSTAPYTFSYTVPTNGNGLLTLEATATDTNGNTATTGPINFTVDPDPGSTVTGLVTDTLDQPLEGAEVTILEGVTTSTGADGRFTVAEVPTLVETYAVRARFTPDGGRTLRGSAMPIAPVRGGTTDVGTIVVREAPLFSGHKFPVEDAPRDVAVADFDGDNALDVVAPIFSTVSRLRYFPGNGDGTLGASVVIDEPQIGPSKVLAADVMGDEHLDLIVAHAAVFSNSPAQISVYPGNGDGTFGKAVVSPLATGNMTTGIDLADFDGNGEVDLVVAMGTNTTNNVEVLLGNGDGSFAAGVLYPAGLLAIDVVVADLDKDDAPDLIAIDQTGHQVFVLFNNADSSGTFQDGALAIAAVPDRLSPSCGTVADFNGDGNLDFAAGLGNASNPSGSAMVALGNGDGTFREQDYYTISGLTSPAPVAIAAADMTGDEILDLVVANRNISEISILPGNGDGSFGTHIAVPSAYFPVALATADMDNDGDLDTVTPNTSFDLMIHFNEGAGDLTPPPLVLSSSGVQEPVSIAAVDLDGDEVQDAVVSFRISDNIGVYRGNADGTFNPPVLYTTGDSPTNVNLGDFNADGFTDVAAPNQSDNTLSLFIGNGDGTLQQGNEIDLTVGNLAGYGTVGRFNDDTFDDIAVTVELANSAVILLGNGDGTFQAPQVLATGPNPQFITNGDVDGDGETDLLVGINAFPGGVELHAGNGDGTFGAADLIFPIANGLFVQNLDVVDLDGDTFMDIVVMTGYSDPVDSKGLGPFQGGFFLLYGREGGGFDDAVFQPGNGIDPGQGSAVDVDGDGLLDLLSASGQGRDISLLLGNGDRTFLPEQRYHMNSAGRHFGGGGARFQVYDANGDGLNDVVAVFGQLNQIQTLLQLP